MPQRTRTYYIGQGKVIRGGTSLHPPDGVFDDEDAYVLFRKDDKVFWSHHRNCEYLTVSSAIPTNEIYEYKDIRRQWGGINKAKGAKTCTLYIPQLIQDVDDAHSEQLLEDKSKPHFVTTEKTLSTPAQVKEGETRLCYILSTRQLTDFSSGRKTTWARPEDEARLRKNGFEYLAELDRPATILRGLVGKEKMSLLLGLEKGEEVEEIEKNARSHYNQIRRLSTDYGRSKTCIPAWRFL